MGISHCFTLGIFHRANSTINILQDSIYNMVNHYCLLFCTFGEIADISGDCGKAVTVLTCHCSPDGGIQCQTICLVGDARNRFRDLTDFA